MKEHLLTGSTWLRGLLMLVFILFFWAIGISAMAIVILVQFGFLLFTGKLNENLLNFGQSLSVYLYQLMLYLTYNSDEKPFPFQKWPDTNELSQHYLTSQVSKETIAPKE